MSFFNPVDPRSREAQEALKALLGTTLAQLNEIDKNVVGTSTNIRGVKTDLKNVLQNIEPVQQPLPQQPPVLQPTPILTEVPRFVEQSQPSRIQASDEKLDKIISLLEDLKNILKQDN